MRGAVEVEVEVEDEDEDERVEVESEERNGFLPVTLAWGEGDPKSVWGEIAFGSGREPTDVALAE